MGCSAPVLGPPAGNARQIALCSAPDDPAYVGIALFADEEQAKAAYRAMCNDILQPGYAPWYGNILAPGGNPDTTMQGANWVITAQAVEVYGELPSGYVSRLRDLFRPTQADCEALSG